MFFLERAAQDYHMVWTACGTENDTCLAYDYCAVVWSFKSVGLWLKEMTGVCVYYDRFCAAQSAIHESCTICVILMMRFVWCRLLSTSPALWGILWGALSLWFSAFRARRDWSTSDGGSTLERRMTFCRHWRAVCSSLR